MGTAINIDYLKNYPQFVPTVAEWIFTQWGHQTPNDTLAAANERVAGRLHTDTIPFTMIALRDGEPVGTASIFAHDMTTRPDLSPWLGAVYVKATARRSGIGSLLVARLEKAAADLGYRRLFLFTPDKMSFYRRQGWDYLEEAHYRGEHVTIMEKVIS